MPARCFRETRMKLAPGSVCRTDWRTSFRRAIDAAALTIFLGPPLGGVAFGIIGDINHFALLAGGHLPWLHATDELVVVFVWPIAAAFAALIVPAAWLAAATASVYVAVRVGITGRITWTETVVLAVLCSLFACLTFQHDFLSRNLRSSLDFLACSVCAALALRHFAGRRGMT